jgi:hypothetical protein
VDLKDFIISEALGEDERLWISGLESKIFQQIFPSLKLLTEVYLVEIRGGENHEEAQEDRGVGCDEHGWLHRTP